MPHARVRAPQSVPEAWQERKDLELQESELLSALLQGYGFFSDFYRLCTRELLPLSTTLLPCKKDATVTNAVPYSKYNCNNLLPRKEDPSLLGRKVSRVLCGMCTLLWGWKFFCCTFAL